MADKQINHPLGLIPSWANDLNLDDPGRPWDGLPSKVEPGVGKRDDGFLPEDNPTAQETNKLINELSRWVQYFSAIQAMNWFDVGAPADKTAGPQFQSGHCITYDEGFVGWAVGGEITTAAGEVSLSADGVTWIEKTGFTAGHRWTWAASKPPSDVPTHTGLRTMFSSSIPSATNVVNEAVVATVNSFAVPGTGTSGINHHIWSKGQALWIYAGGSNLGVTPQPAIWTQVAGAALVLRAATPVASANAILVAADDATGGLVVVIGDATPFDVWTSSNGFTFTRATPTGITAGQSAKSLLWDSARQVFVLLTEKETYTSTDGVAWTLISTLPGTSLDFQVRCFDYDRGGLYIAAGDGLPVNIRFSTDGGVTWRFIPIPPAHDPGDGGTADPTTAVYYAAAIGRFATLWGQKASGTDANMSLSLAVGESLHEADAVTISVPTVT